MSFETIVNEMVKAAINRAQVARSEAEEKAREATDLAENAEALEAIADKLKEMATD